MAEITVHLHARSQPITRESDGHDMLLVEITSTGPMAGFRELLLFDLDDYRDEG